MIRVNVTIFSTLSYWQRHSSKTDFFFWQIHFLICSLKRPSEKFRHQPCLHFHNIIQKLFPNRNFQNKKIYEWSNIYIEQQPTRFWSELETRSYFWKKNPYVICFGSKHNVYKCKQPLPFSYALFCVLIQPSPFQTRIY